MKTQSNIRRLLSCLALLTGLSGGLAWSQGTQPQTLTWQGTANEILTPKLAYPLGATASSGLPATIRVDRGPAVIANGTITVTGLGTVEVTADQAGDVTYAAARVTRSFNVRHVALSPVGRVYIGGGALSVQVVGNNAYVASVYSGLQVLDVSNPAEPLRVGGYETSHSARGVQVVGNYAFLADGETGLQVIDVSNPADPVRVGGYNTFGEAYRVQVAGNYAFVADWDAGMQVIDVSDRAKPVRVGRYDTTGRANDLQVVGSYAYVADGDGGLRVINVNNPARPVSAGSVGTSGTARAVQVRGNYAYVADGSAGLQVIDISNPANPTRVGGFDTAGWATGVYLVENYAYVATGGLVVLDVSNPANPVRVGGDETIEYSVGVMVVGNHVYVADFQAGLQILELKLGYPQVITWPETTNEILAPKLAHPLNATASSALPVTFRVDSGPAVITEGTITVTGLGTVVVTAEQAGDAMYLPARLTRSFNLRQVTLSSLGRYDTSGSARSVQVVGNYAYVADFDAGLQVIDVSNPSKPVRAADYNTSGTALGVQVLGNYAYVADWDAGLQVIDVSNPGHPTRAGGYRNADRVTGVQVVGNYAFVDNYGFGVEVVDISNPARPVQVGVIDAGVSACGLQAMGNYAYVANGYVGLQVIEISNPAKPRRVGGYNTSGRAEGVHVVGNYAYVADGTAGLQVIDVSHPANPVRVGGANIIDPANGVHVVGNYAYVAGSGLVVFDVSNPASPMPVGRFGTNSISCVQVAGNYAFVADGTAGLQILKIMQGYPQTLTWAGTTNEILTVGVAHSLSATANTGRPVMLRVENGPAEIADGTITVTGVGTVVVTAEQVGDAAYLPTRVTRSFNVRQAQLTLVGGYRTTRQAFDVQVVGDYAYMAFMGYWNGEKYVGGGLQVIDVRHPASPVRVGGYDKRGIALALQVVGNYAYLAVGEAGLEVIDVSDPVGAKLVGRVGTSGSASDVQAVGNYLYVAGRGLRVYDVSNPARLVYVAHYDTGGWARGLQVLGNYAYVADYYTGLQVIDVSQPASLVRTGGVEPPGHARGVHVVGNYAYVADDHDGLQVIDIGNSANPVRVGGYSMSGSTPGVHVVGNYAYVAKGWIWDGLKVAGAGLRVIDVSNPALPVPVGRYDTGAEAYAVQVVGNYVYVAAGDELQILGLKLGFRQALELQLPPSIPFHGSPVFAAGASSSGLPITLSVLSGSAIVVNNQLFWTGLGPVTLSAEQAGNEFFLPVSAQWSVTVTPPRLGVGQADGHVELFWAAGITGLQLQGAESLEAGGQWRDFTTPPVEADGLAIVRLAETGTQAYFRLLKP